MPSLSCYSFIISNSIHVFWCSRDISLALTLLIIFQTNLISASFSFFWISLSKHCLTDTHQPNHLPPHPPPLVLCLWPARFYPFFPSLFCFGPNIHLYAAAAPLINTQHIFSFFYFIYNIIIETYQYHLFISNIITKVLINK